MQKPEVIASVIAVCIIVYGQLVRASDHTLMSILVMSVFAGAAMYYVKDDMRGAADADTKKKQSIESDIAESRRETAIPGSYALPVTFPKKGFRYLYENQSFVEIVDNIRVLKHFDKAKYGDIVFLFDQLQKTYMYILAGRYDPVRHLANFMDTRDALLEQIYGMIFALPGDFKHIYGVSPHYLAEETVLKTTAVTRTMAGVLKSFAKKTAKSPHIPAIAELPAPAPSATSTSASHMRLP